MTPELLPEFDQEMGVTRRLLRCAPAASFEWTPHPRSFTLGALCTHLARLPHWGRRILEESGYDLVTDHRPAEPARVSPDLVLADFDAAVAAVRDHLTTLSEAELRAPWTLSRNGESVLTAPRVTAFRTFVIHHTVHHRGQLSVYLRLLDVPLPPIYGPTADQAL